MSPPRCARQGAISAKSRLEDASAATPGAVRRTRAPPRLPPGGASTFWERESARAPLGAAGDAPALPPQKLEESPTDVLVLGTSQTHSSTVIWLHGKAGDPPRAWLRALAKLNMPWCKFLLPVAATRPGAARREGGSDGELGMDSMLLEPTGGWDDGAE